MITITKEGKFIIPQEESFIGYAGDNLNATREFFVEGVTDMSLIYRMYLLFDEGSCNYFLLDSEVQENGTLLTWNVENEHIFKSGLVQVQIKASNPSGEVFHSGITNMIVLASVEFSDVFVTKENSEFLKYERSLNQMTDYIEKTLNIANDARVEALKVYDSITYPTKDTAPIENSDNCITSGGVYTALQGKYNMLSGRTISSLKSLNGYRDLYTIYSLTILPGVIPILGNNVCLGKMINNSTSQNIYLADGRVFSRGSSDEEQFVQICYNKKEIDEMFASLSA